MLRSHAMDSELLLVVSPGEEDTLHLSLQSPQGEICSCMWAAHASHGARALALPEPIALALYAAKRPFRLWVQCPRDLAGLAVEQVKVAGLPGGAAGEVLSLKTGIQVVRWAGVSGDWPPHQPLWGRGRPRVLLLSCPWHPRRGDQSIPGVERGFIAARERLDDMHARGQVRLEGAFELPEALWSKPDQWLEELPREGGGIDLLIYVGHGEHSRLAPASPLVTVPSGDGSLMAVDELLRKIGAATGAPVKAAFVAACDSSGVWAAELPPGARAVCGVLGRPSGAGIMALVEEFVSALALGESFVSSCRRAWSASREAASRNDSDQPVEGLTIGLRTQDSRLPDQEEMALAKYRQGVRHHYGTIGWLDEKRLPLEEAYQELSLLVPDEDPGEQPGSDVPRFHRRRLIDQLALCEEAGGALVLADPGAGKSTLLKATAYELAGANEKVPLYVHLPWWPRSGGDLVSLAEAAARQALGDDQWDEMPPHLRSAMLNALRAAGRRGEVVLLLDGVDEVGMISQQMLHRILHLAQTGGRLNHAVVASRPAGETGTLVASLNLGRPCGLSSFAPNQVQDLAEKEMGQGGQGMVRRLKQSEEAWKLARNPFFLRTMISLYAQNDLALPTGLRALYSDLVQRLIHRRSEAILREGELLEDLVSSMFIVLKAVAGKMAVGADQGTGQISTEELKELCPDDRLSVALRSQSGILQPTGRDGRRQTLWSFAHRSLEEYFAGWWLASKVKEHSTEYLTSWIVEQGIIDPGNCSCRRDKFEVIRWAGAHIEGKEELGQLFSWLYKHDDELWFGTYLVARIMAIVSDDAYGCCAQALDVKISQMVADKIGRLTLTKEGHWELWRTNYLGVFERMEYPEKTLLAFSRWAPGRYLAELLSNLGVSGFVKCLGRLSESKSQPRRWKAAAHLGFISEPGAVDALIKYLDDRDEVVRQEAAIALHRHGDPRAAPALASKLEDPSDKVRPFVRDALNKCDGSQPETSLLGLPADKREHQPRADPLCQHG